MRYMQSTLYSRKWDIVWQSTRLTISHHILSRLHPRRYFYRIHYPRYERRNLRLQFFT